jgi:putative FmdB family regulatory protein
MPLYEYYCSDCKSKFELIVSHKHADGIVCMKCQSEQVRRLLSVFSARRAGTDDGADYDTAPSMGGCACGGGGCGCS